MLWLFDFDEENDVEVTWPVSVSYELPFGSDDDEDDDEEDETLLVVGDIIMEFVEKYDGKIDK